MSRVIRVAKGLLTPIPFVERISITTLFWWSFVLLMPGSALFTYTPTWAVFAAAGSEHIWGILTFLMGASIITTAWAGPLWAKWLTRIVVATWWLVVTSMIITVAPFTTGTGLYAALAWYSLRSLWRHA